jgi:DNA-binding NtrC family response regulator/predicted hydrocarbon binding protein
MSDGSELGVDIGALSARLRFNPEDGCIWLEGERMVLLHQAALAALRKELIDTLGLEAARGIFTRMGHVGGAVDAALARRAKPGEDILTTFMAGPRLHAIEGIVSVDPIGHEFDPDTSFHAGEWIWRNSVEVEAHLANYGLSHEPVCWAAIGYASAYTSGFMGRPILYREVECRGAGASHCRIVGKPAELWEEDVRDDLHLGFDLADLDELASGDWYGAAPEAEDEWWRRDRMVGASPAFVSTMQLVGKVAPTDAPVLIVGEIGVGRKSCARALHRLSARARQPIATFNCSSVAGAALDVELFGIEKGAPGGSAVASRQGRIERANGGTLFLEDIHCLDLGAQAKLLRVLQTGEVERVGGSQPRPVKVRLIASANDRLHDAVAAGGFREDLYYKLTAFPIRIAPLRERRADIPLLIKHFVTVFAARHCKKVSGVSQSAVGYLLTHDFPGNVAELESMIERAVILAAPDAPLDVAHLGHSLDETSPRFFGVSRAGMLVPGGTSNAAAAQGAATLDHLLDTGFELDAFENDIILRAVERAEGNLSAAARALGMTRPQLAYRYKKAQESCAPGAGDRTP